MAVVLENDIIQALWKGTLFGQTVMTGMHWVVGIGAGGGVEMGAFIGELRTYLDGSGHHSARLAACYSTDLTNINLIIQDIYPIRYVRSIQLSSSPQGTQVVASITLPPNVCGVIWLRGERAGRDYRSVKHIGGMADVFTEGGYLTGSALSAYGNYASQCAAEINLTVSGTPVTLYPVVYHRADPALSRPIKTWEVPDTCRVERRRTVGLGE